MTSIAKKTILGFACVIGLLLTGSPVQAQEGDPVPAPNHHSDSDSDHNQHLRRKIHLWRSA